MTEFQLIDPFDSCPKLPCLIADEYKNILVACTVFDYYDAKWWAPLPIFPQTNIITNDQWVINLRKKISENDQTI